MSHQHNQHHHGHDTKTLKDLEREIVEHDTWFRHDANEPHHQESHGETNGWKINAFLFIVILLVGASSYGMFKYYKMAEQKEIYKKYDLRTEQFGGAELNAMKEEWNRQLSTAGWVDANARVARLPIDVATQLVINDYKAKGAR